MDDHEVRPRGTGCFDGNLPPYDSPPRCRSRSRSVVPTHEVWVRRVVRSARPWVRVGRVVSGRGLTGHFPPRCRSQSCFSGGQTDPPAFSLPPGRAARPVEAMVVSWFVYIAIRPPTNPAVAFCRLLGADVAVSFAIVGSSPQPAVSLVDPLLQLVVCPVQTAVVGSVGRDQSRFRLSTIGATLRPWHFRAMHMVEGVWSILQRSI